MSTTVIVSQERHVPHAIVVVFLRGGADGLHLLVPHGDDGYHQARPTIGLTKNECIDLNGFFGLNKNLAPLHSLWQEGRMSAIHSVGSEDETRSHFEAQDFMEHGGLVAGGWLGRFLRSRPDQGQSPLTAVAIGPRLPECLRGAPSCTALQSLEQFGLGRHATPEWITELARLYEQTPGTLGMAGAHAIGALKRIESLNKNSYQPAHGSRYETDAFSQGMRQIAQLLKAEIGLQAATINLDGWDSHLTQSAVIDGPIHRLAAGLSMFARDLGAERMERTTVVVMTEFGRRVSENSAAGTDHGTGSVMFVLGGGISGGQVFGDWQAIDPSKLVGPGDLPVRYNYRDLLARILTRISPETAMDKVFPSYVWQPVTFF